MTKNGKLSKREMETLNKAWEILSRWTEVAEADDWGEKWESRAIDCGATKGGHMWAFYGWASC